VGHGIVSEEKSGTDGGKVWSRGIESTRRLGRKVKSRQADSCCCRCRRFDVLRCVEVVAWPFVVIAVVLNVNERSLVDKK